MRKKEGSRKKNSPQILDSSSRLQILYSFSFFLIYFVLSRETNCKWFLPYFVHGYSIYSSCEDNYLQFFLISFNNGSFWIAIYVEDLSSIYNFCDVYAKNSF